MRDMATGHPFAFKGGLLDRLFARLYHRRRRGDSDRIIPDTREPAILRVAHEIGHGLGRFSRAFGGTIVEKTGALE